MHSKANAKRKSEFMASLSGQGTIEYLVIIGIVVVIALVVVAILLGFLGQGQTISKQQSALFWQSQPVAVMESAADSNGYIQLIIKNNGSERVTLNTIRIDSVDFNVENGAGKSMPAGQIYDFRGTGVSACTGTEKQYKLRISYTSKLNLPKTITEKDILVPCVTYVGGSNQISNFFFSGTPTEGVIMVWNTIAGTWRPALNVTLDTNKLCLGASCAGYIDWNSTDLIISD